MPQLMWCVYVCVPVLQWATYMASACWMLRAWWRRLSAGNKFPRSVSVWRRPPSSWEGIRPAALRERSPLWVGASPWFLRFHHTLSISVSAPASGSSHTDSHTHFNGCHFLYCSSACVSLPLFFNFFLKPPLSSLLLTASLLFFPVSSQSYSSRLRADVCVRERRLLRQAPAARCLCGACRRTCYHHSRASRRPFHYARVPFRHRVAAAGKQVTKSNAQSRTGCVES